MWSIFVAKMKHVFVGGRNAAGILLVFWYHKRTLESVLFSNKLHAVSDIRGFIILLSCGKSGKSAVTDRHIDHWPLGIRQVDTGHLSRKAADPRPLRSTPNSGAIHWPESDYNTQFGFRKFRWNIFKNRTMRYKAQIVNMTMGYKAQIVNVVSRKADSLLHCLSWTHRFIWFFSSWAESGLYLANVLACTQTSQMTFKCLLVSAVTTDASSRCRVFPSCQDFWKQLLPPWFLYLPIHFP